MIVRGIVVARRPDGELGLFATRTIAKCEVLLTYDGPRLDHPTRLSVQIDDQMHIDGTETSNAFLNHSCSPTGYVDWNGPVLRALRDIAAGEEITCNYLTTDAELHSPFVCHCGSPSCHGLIRGWNFVDAKTEADLEPFFPPFRKNQKRAGWSPRPVRALS